MANENIGGISWVVDADTAPATNSVKAMDSTVKKTESTLKKLDTQTTKTAKAVNKGIGSMGRTAGQAGIQMQQFIGQIQGGQNAMLALSAQSADLGFVLGAPLLGAIVGISASVAGMLLPSLLNSKSAAEELEKALDLLKDITHETSDGTLVLSESMEKLAKKSRDLAEIEIALGLVNAQKAIKAASKEILDASDDWEHLFSFVNLDSAVNEIKNLEAVSKRMGLSQVDVMKQIGDSYTGSIAEITQITEAVKQVSKEFGSSTTQSLGFLKSIEQLKKSNTPENMAAVAAAVHSITMSLDKPNEKLLTLDKRLGTAAISALSARDVIKLLDKATKDLTGTLDDSSESADTMRSKVDVMVSSLEEQVKQLKESARQTAVRLAIDNKATSAQIASINAAFDKIEANKQQIKTQKELDEQMDASFNAEVNRERKRKAEAKKVETGATSIADTRGDPIKALQAQKAAELKVLKEAEQAGLQLHTDYTTLRQNIDNQYAEAEAAAREKKFAAESEMNALALSSIEALGGASANVIQGMLSGTMTARDAMLQFSNAILNEVIGSLVSIGVQYAKNALIEKTIDASAMTAKQAMMAAQAAEHTAAVTAAVAELASLGAAGAIAATAAIPIVGPALAPAAGAAMAGIVGAAGAPAIAAAPIAGMREHGGSVISGQTYEVGEKNKPELLMIPGNNGKVLSNSEMKGLAGGGGGGYQPIINNYAAADGYRVEARRDELTRQDVFDIVRNEMTDPNSRGRRGMQGNSNLHGVLNGQRRS
jgi:hypothetical protein